MFADSLSRRGEKRRGIANSCVLLVGGSSFFSLLDKLNHNWGPLQGVGTLPAHEAEMGEAQSCLACDSKRSNGTTSARKPVATTHIRCAVPQRPRARDGRVSQFGPFSGQGLQLSACARLHVARLHVARGSSRKMSAGRVMMGVRWAQREQNAVREH